MNLIDDSETPFFLKYIEESMQKTKKFILDAKSTSFM
jgi:hypothetical protein